MNLSFLQTQESVFLFVQYFSIDEKVSKPACRQAGNRDLLNLLTFSAKAEFEQAEAF